MYALFMSFPFIQEVYMLDFLITFNEVVFWILTAAYFYQMVYLGIGFFTRNRKNEKEAKKLYKYAAIIAARNESNVIGEIIKNLKDQNYPSELLDVFVIADNCTDNTAQVARDCGAIVYERQNKEFVGKGYALDYLFKHILAEHKDAAYDAFLIFDADNLIDENFVREMNKMYDNGYRASTSYRNSKNYGTNWITAGYSLWFLREARYLNHPRMQLKTNCAVSGTGFMIAREIIERQGGWNYHLLTEDIEFSVDCAIKGELIGYCEGARVYDEQPTTFKQSWTQRMRWSKGFYQVTSKYAPSLIKGIFKHKNAMPCYDMLMTIAPATLLTLFCILVNSMLVFASFLEPQFFQNIIMGFALKSIIVLVINFYLMFLGMGAMTMLTEHKQILATRGEKIGYLFTFPIFMITYVPICIVALFKKVEWKPITHKVVKSLNEVR